MSAFLCSPTHFAQLASSMLYYAEHRSSGHWYATHAFLREATGVSHKDDDLPALTKTVLDATNQLYRLNQLALLGCYGDAYTPGTVVTTIERREPLTGVAFVKALNCLSYQCSEPIASEMRLFDALARYENAIAATVVRHLPAYDAAAWELAA